MDSIESGSSKSSVGLLIASVVLTAAAAGMGWGIRGQYGHETGAMIAGALASITLVMLYIPNATSLAAARAAAMMTVAIGIGGQMTYGQTVGLTHDSNLIGNWEALQWGMIGLGIKGAVWIGFGGLFLGMGLSSAKYRPFDMFVLFVVMFGLMFLGIWLLNSPYAPSAKEIPWIYFSDNWYFEPDQDLSPRRETWGGLLLALLGAGCYAFFVRRDRLALRMLLVGMLAGGLGFPGGQSVQAFANWNREMFTEGALAPYNEYFSYFNWWNMMETTFGCIFGAVLAAGVWFNARLISPPDDDEIALHPIFEIVVVAVHLLLVMFSEFIDTDTLSEGSMLAKVELYTDYGILMTALPLFCIVGGRIAPYLFLLVVVPAPIAGKTILNLVFQSQQMSPAVG
ncbi:MAG: hypothetical protein KDB27_07590, partial [Planctomycetales bacterium]|nr:hypothetical protein [Planctomycetales bacterium]